MKKYARPFKDYDKIEFDQRDVLSEMSRLKGEQRKPTSVALEMGVIKELKTISQRYGMPYQVLMRLLIKDGIRRIRRY